MDDHIITLEELLKRDDIKNNITSLHLVLQAIGDLESHNKNTTPTDITAEIHKDKHLTEKALIARRSVISRSITRLKDNDLIQIRNIPIDDERKKPYELTAHGKELLEWVKQNGLGRIRDLARKRKREEKKELQEYEEALEIRKKMKRIYEIMEKYPKGGAINPKDLEDE